MARRKSLGKSIAGFLFQNLQGRSAMDIDRPRYKRAMKAKPVPKTRLERKVSRVKKQVMYHEQLKGLKSSKLKLIEANKELDLKIKKAKREE